MSYRPVTKITDDGQGINNKIIKIEVCLQSF